MSRLVWVAVPGGPVAGGGALLRVVVVPVLDQPLADAGMTSWPPPSLEGATLVVEALDETGTTAREVVAQPRLKVVPGAWEALFGALGVEPAGSRERGERRQGREGPDDRAERTVVVAPTVADSQQVAAAYGAAVVAGGADAAATSAEAAAGVQQVLNGPDVAETMSRARGRSRDRRGNTNGRTRPDRGRDRRRAPGDANLAVSMLREHPTVMRALGLVIDLPISATDLVRLPARGRLRVTWADAPDEVPHVDSRWTAYRRDGFRPRPRAGSPLHTGGTMVRLSDPAWQVVTFDPEQALGGLASAATTGGLPPVRSAGLLLAHTGREADLAARLGKPSLATESDAASDTVLWADDLVLGYRLDVRPDGASQWRSLTARTATYSADDVVIAEGVSEEGQVKVGAAVDEGDRLLRATEVVTRWDGWSLAVPRPGSRRARAGSPDGPYRLTSRLAVPPGSLPRLVFGEGYDLRVRVADLAGGGPTLAAQSPDGCDLAAIIFPRHESVAAPLLTHADGAVEPPAAYGQGAGLRSLVVRTSDWEQAPETGTADDTERELRAPTVPLDVVERHGLTAPGRGTDTAALASRAGETGVRGLPDPASGGLVGWVRLPGDTVADHEPLAWSDDWAAPTDTAAVPVGTAPWPDLPARALVLLPRGDDVEPTLAWEDGRLVVRLDPGTEAEVEVSSFLHDGARAGFALSQWLTQTAATTIGPVELARLERELGAGRNPLATPAQVVRVRHAVRRQREAPSGTPTVSRVESATYADVGPGETAELLGVHPGSTSAVEVTAGWTPQEDVDDPPVVAGTVGRIEVPLGATSLGVVRHELGDTKHREVTYILTALSRYRDCFADGADPEAEGFSIAGVLAPVHVLSSARPPTPVVRAAVPGFTWRESVTADGTVRRERLGNRVRLQLDAPWYATGDGERLVVLPATQAGRDPIWLTPEVPRHPVVRGPVVSVQVPVPAAESAAPPDPMVEPGAVATVLAPPVDAVAQVAWPSAGAWWADVVLEPQPSYGALLQLVVARHQPWSLTPSIATSEAVTTDFVPLLPDRTLTISPTATTIDVVLDGLGPEGPAGNVVDVSLQVPLSDAAAPDGTVVELDESGRAWRAVAAEQVALGSTATLDRPGGEVRVVVRELEQVLSGLPEAGPFPDLARRVVFVDSVVL